MKRTLALTLAAIFIASVLASCAVPNEESATNSRIRTTSSDGESEVL